MGLTVGVDLGGTKIAAGVVDDEGRVLVQERRPTPSRDPEAVEAAIIGVVNEFVVQYPVSAVGIGAAGSGVRAENLIATDVVACIDGDGSSGISADSVTLNVGPSFISPATFAISSTQPRASRIAFSAVSGS